MFGIDEKKIKKREEEEQLQMSRNQILERNLRRIKLKKITPTMKLAK